jgi:hypothetical protein
LIAAFVPRQPIMGLDGEHGASGMMGCGGGGAVPESRRPGRLNPSHGPVDEPIASRFVVQ